MEEVGGVGGRLGKVLRLPHERVGYARRIKLLTETNLGAAQPLLSPKRDTTCRA